jgi:pantoate--beta-alanine ligase
MIIVKNAASLTQILSDQRMLTPELGFVPTMGALHRGHLELINTSRQECGFTISSIFVNPTQFNDPKDFEKYPITLENDVYLLEKAGCDCLFLPSVTEVYPGGMAHLEHYPLGYLESIFEGKYRPGHFQGVCQVVYRLLKMVNPASLFIGQKDYQQCMVIKRLTEITSTDVRIRICATVREASGLAMSSRNARLSEENRNKAAEIYKTLQFIKESIKPGPLTNLTDTATQRLNNAGFKTDYVALAAEQNLQPVDDWDGTQNLVALAAAFLGDVRLIDNIVL